MYPSGKDKEHFFQLLTKYNAGTATPEETEFVTRYLEMLEHRPSAALQDFEAEKAQIAGNIKNQLLHSIRQEAQPPAAHRVHFLRTYRWWAAAAILILLTAGGYLLFQLNRPAAPQIAQATVPAAIQPGRSGAILTLADGSQLVLDSLQNGLVATQGNTQVKLHNGQLLYDKSGAAGQGKLLAYNTMRTPKGRQYQLVLPDGTKVWLNAASSLTYPTAFSGKEREVQVSGEAYFEVAQNAQQPFKVKINEGTSIQVLGTHFNVNAYTDEASINTTLLEGAVKVVTKGKAQLLHPGQQARVQEKGSGNITLVQNAAVNEAIAWKNGSFSFTNADLPAVMRQLARWYNIEVSYSGAVPDAVFSGEIDRSLTLDQVLKGLSKTRIHYRIDDGNKLVILP